MAQLHPAFDVPRSPFHEINRPVEALGSRLEQQLEALKGMITTTYATIIELEAYAKALSPNSPEIDGLRDYLVTLESKLDTLSIEHAALSNRLDVVLRFLEHNINHTAEA